MCLAALFLWSTPTVAAPAEHPAAEEDPLAAIKTRLAKQYPDVQHVAISDYLAQHPDALLVDVRSAAEYAVSRIPSAVHIEDRDALLAFAKEQDGASILLYCSVGARSAAAAKYLGEQKIRNVMNLEGSIFEWANQERPLENAEGATDEVHSFNAWWGWRYLKR